MSARNGFSTDTHPQIEFPSILLPADIHSGSIVDINVARNQQAETVTDKKFAALQSDIFTTFGTQSPQPPVIRCRNTTQTSVVLEWDPIDLATAELRSLSLYRNGSKAGNIPMGKLSTKISGLALDTEYTFHLVLRTSAGQYSSERLTVKTHKLTDLHGITITPGIMPSPLKESLGETVQQIGAKMIDSVRIDTTHFVCTEPRGQAWEKALEMNVPVVVPDWVKGCQREGKIIGVRAYYLDADPSKRQLGPSASAPASRGSVSTAGGQMRESPRIEHTPPTPERAKAESSPTREQVAPTSAPAVPPKPSTEVAVPEEDGRSSMTGTTLAEKQRDDEDGVDDDDDERGEAAKSNDPEEGAGAEVEGEGKQPQDNSHDQEQTTERQAAKIAEEDGKFDEVDL